MSGLWTTAPQGVLYAALAMIPVLAKRTTASARIPARAPVRDDRLRAGQSWWTP